MDHHLEEHIELHHLMRVRRTSGIALRRQGVAGRVQLVQVLLRRRVGMGLAWARQLGRRTRTIGINGNGDCLRGQMDA